MQRKQKYIKTVFISDIHLGSRICKIDRLNILFDSFEKNLPEKIVIVGDFIDIWLLKSRVYWKQEYNDLLLKLFSFSKRGVKIVYIPGNHDEDFRDYCDSTFGNISIVKEYIHENSKLGKLWVLHGDEFDIFITKYKFLGKVGGYLYDYLIFISEFISFCRRKFGCRDNWSLSNYLKQKAKHATKIIDIFKTTLIDVAKSKNYDGIIVGHIHKPEIVTIKDMAYLNTGDWTENCSYIVEYSTDEIELLFVGEKI